MKKLGTIIDLNKMSLLGVEIDVLQEALDQDGIDGLNRLAEAMDLKLKYVKNHDNNNNNNKTYNDIDNGDTNDLTIGDLNVEEKKEDDEMNALDVSDHLNHPAFNKIANIIAMSRSFADKKMENFKDDRGDYDPPEPPEFPSNQPSISTSLKSTKTTRKKSLTRWGPSSQTKIDKTNQQKIAIKFNEKIKTLKKTSSERRGTYYGMYSKDQATDLRSRGRTTSSTTTKVDNKVTMKNNLLSSLNNNSIQEDADESDDEDRNDSNNNNNNNVSSNGIVREGRGWSNVLVRVKERVVSPVKRHFTSLKEIENFIQPDISPRSDNSFIVFHDFDLATGKLWTFKRFHNILTYIRNQEDLYPKNAMDGMLPKHLVIEPLHHVADMSQSEFNAKKTAIKRQGGKHNFPLLVSETIAVLELLWSMKDNDDDLFICNPSYWLHSYISQLQLKKKIQKKKTSKRKKNLLFKFTDAIEKLLSTRHGRTSFIHVRDIKESDGSKQAFMDASKRTTTNDSTFNLLQEDQLYETLIHGYTLIDHNSKISNLMKYEDELKNDAVDDEKNHQMLLNTLRRKTSLNGPVVPFICKHVGSKIQIGVSCCRACSITAYQRYASGSSGDYSMGKTLNENETMFKVCLANGKCEEFKPYNLNEISIIFRTMAIRNPYDVHPVYLSHDKHLYWNVVKFFGSCTQAIRILFEPSVGNSIIISWAYIKK